MLLNLLSIAITLASIAIIFAIVSRKFKVLSSIDVSSLSSEKEASVKEKLITERLGRRLSSFKAGVGLVVSPLMRLTAWLGGIFSKWYEALLALKEAHRRSMVVGGANALTSEEMRFKKIEELLHQGKEFLREEKYVQAEGNYIEIIKLDKKAADAYMGLGDIYLYNREWEKAREVLTYACKLLADHLRFSQGEEAHEVSQKLINSLFDLSVVYNELSRLDKALECLKKARELDSKSPKILDALVEQYIMLKQRLWAERALEQLREANADNQKLPELENRIKQLSY